MALPRHHWFPPHGTQEAPLPPVRGFFMSAFLFWTQCEGRFDLNDSCEGDVARRSLGRGKLFRGFFVSQLLRLLTQPCFGGGETFWREARCSGTQL